MIQFLLYHPAHLELHMPFGGHVNLFEGLWVPGFSGGSCLYVEYAEITGLQAVALIQFIHDLVQKGLHNFLSRYRSDLMDYSDFVNPLLFGDCSHSVSSRYFIFR